MRKGEGRDEDGVKEKGGKWRKCLEIKGDRRKGEMEIRGEAEVRRGVRKGKEGEKEGREGETEEAEREWERRGEKGGMGRLREGRGKRLRAKKGKELILN